MDLFVNVEALPQEPPTIISPPEDTYGPTGANLTLDCEARGFPAPAITWQYENTEGRTWQLPSDDQDISIQVIFLGINSGSMSSADSDLFWSNLFCSPKIHESFF